MPNDETGRDKEFVRQFLICRLFGLSAKRLEGGVCELGAGKSNGCEGRQGELGEIDVFETNDGEIVGHAQALRIGSVEDADGGHIVRADDGSWAGGKALQPLKSGDAAPKPEVALDDPFFLDGQAG